MADQKITVRIIACIGPNYELGNHGQLVYKLKGDMHHFKMLTGFSSVIMGRKTWESLPVKNRPLPHRQNIIITRNPDYKADGAVVCASLEEAIEKAKSNTVWIIGGGQIYKEAMEKELVDYLHMTHCEAAAECDTYFPIIDPDKWTAVDYSPVIHEEDDPGTKYQFITWVKKKMT